MAENRHSEVDEPQTKHFLENKKNRFRASWASARPKQGLIGPKIRQTVAVIFCFLVLYVFIVASSLFLGGGNSSKMAN